MHLIRVFILRGIVDQYSTSFGAYPILNASLGNNLKVYASNTSIYHNKYLIVDASDFCSDPQVLTGSHNWSTSADRQNDENTVIVHSDTIANIYYQAFSADFTSLGGTLTKIPNCVTTTTYDIKKEPSVVVYPNPNAGRFIVKGINKGSIITMYDEFGNIVKTFTGPDSNAFELNISGLANGIYLIRVVSETGTLVVQMKILKIGE